MAPLAPADQLDGLGKFAVGEDPQVEVLGAAATGRLDELEARRCLDSLFRSSLWVSPRVRAEAMGALDALFGE